MKTTETVVIGGGLAGLTAALLLQHHGRDVVLLEAKAYPRHKVCGEFISREVVPLFDALELWPAYELESITFARLSTASGKLLSFPLSHGAIGWSRHAMDAHLAGLFRERGGVLLERAAVRKLRFEHKQLEMVLSDDSRWRSKLALGAMGKRSVLDQALGAKPSKRSPWMGWKMHYRHPAFPFSEVQLHNFPGGYAGLSRVEGGKVNMAVYLHKSAIRGNKAPWTLVQTALSQNPHLAAFLATAEPLFEQALAVSQLDYSTKTQVAKGLLMLGDAAGMIHPLSGNGMAMAIGSAQLAVEAALPFLNGKCTRQHMEHQYAARWKLQYAQRLRVSRVLRFFFAASGKSEWGLRMALQFPSLTRWLEKQTHGKAPAL